MAGRKRRTFLEVAQQNQPKVEEKVVVVRGKQQEE